MPTRSSAQTQAHGAARPTRRRRCRSHLPITSNTRLPHANEIIHAGTRAATRAPSASSPNPAISISWWSAEPNSLCWLTHDAPDAHFACRFAALAGLRRERAGAARARLRATGKRERVSAEASRHREAAHGCRRPSAGGRSRARHPTQRRQRGRRGHRHADGAQSGRAAILGYRRRGLHSLLGRRRQAARKHRRPRDRARRRHARALPRCERQAAAARRGHGERSFGRRARRARRAEARPRQARQAALGGTV